MANIEIPISIDSIKNGLAKVSSEGIYKLTFTRPRNIPFLPLNLEIDLALPADLKQIATVERIVTSDDEKFIDVFLKIKPDTQQPLEAGVSGKGLLKVLRWATAPAILWLLRMNLVAVHKIIIAPATSIIAGVVGIIAIGVFISKKRKG